MTTEQATRYAELTAELGALLAAAYGQEAVSEDRLDIVVQDVELAARDCLEEEADEECRSEVARIPTSSLSRRDTLDICRGCGGQCDPEERHCPECQEGWLLA